MTKKKHCNGSTNLSLKCEWIGCGTADPIFDDIAVYMDHVTEHLRDAAQDIATIAAASEPRMSIANVLFWFL